MWAKHDEIAMPKRSEALYHAREGEAVTAAFSCAARAAAAVEEMIYKEEKILLPMSLKTLPKMSGRRSGRLRQVWLVPGRAAWVTASGVGGEKAMTLPTDGVIMLPTATSVEQLHGRLLSCRWI